MSTKLMSIQHKALVGLLTLPDRVKKPVPGD